MSSIFRIIRQHLGEEDSRYSTNVELDQVSLELFERFLNSKTSNGETLLFKILFWKVLV